MIRVLGVDPGSHITGYGVIDVDDSNKRLIETGIIQPDKTQQLHIRIYKIHKVLNALITEYKPDVVVLEKIYSHRQHPATVGVLGHVRGVICLSVAANEIDLKEYSVKRVRKAITGNGNATKSQTKRLVAQVLNIPESKLTLDASDALALAVGHSQMAHSPITLNKS